jgi:outer membrane protein assembly factor BamB
MIEKIKPRRVKRLWIPAATLAGSVGGVAALVYRDSADPVQQYQLYRGLFLGTPLLLIVWLIFLSGLRWWQRFAYLLIGSVVASGLFFGLIDGSRNGSGLPRLRWAWTRNAEASLKDLKVEANAGRVAWGTPRVTDYPQFLGRGRDGHSHGVRLDCDWKAQPPKELWRKKIGLGWSAFAVAGDYAVTQEQREDMELVVCYELKTGKARWSHEDRVRFRDQQGGDGPRATPTLFEDRVYTMGGTGILHCLDGATGESLWSHDILTENGLTNLTWGKSCSPLVFEDKVIVTGGKERRDSLLAYHKDTGQLLWKAGEDEAGYSSPTLATLAGKKQILIVNAHSVTGHDPRDGKVLWTFAWPSGIAKASQPVPLSGDRVFISAGYNVGCVLLHVTYGSARPLWSSRKMRTKFSNVVLARSCAFGLDDRYLACIDLETGEQRWKGARYEFGQVLLVGDVLLVQAEKGYVALVEANVNEFKEIARMKGLQSRTWSNPALSGPYLLVRNDEEAVCYELPLREAED